MLSGVESSAAKILTRAIEMEKSCRYQTALVCYQEGIDLLLEVLKGKVLTYFFHVPFISG